MHKFAIALALACSCALAGCTAPTEPDPLSGTYVLSSVFGSGPPPVTMYLNFAGRTGPVVVRSELFADTLVLNADGTWQERSTSRTTENETTNPVVTWSLSVSTGRFTHGASGGLTFVTDTAGITPGGWLRAINMKSVAAVSVSADTLLVPNLTWSGLTWDPRFVRRR